MNKNRPACSCARELLIGPRCRRAVRFDSLTAGRSKNRPSKQMKSVYRPSPRSPQLRCPSDCILIPYTFNIRFFPFLQRVVPLLVPRPANITIIISIPTCVAFANNLLFIQMNMHMLFAVACEPRRRPLECTVRIECLSERDRVEEEEEEDEDEA